MIECRSVTKRFQGRVAVRSVNLTIESGICVLLGPNGAGKSTLLKLMTGLLTPDAGAVLIGGFDVVREAAAAKRMMGVLPEELGLFDVLTVAENLRAVGPIYGLSVQETDARSNSLLKMLRLEHARHTRAGECSYGMRKKTGLAMALLHNPRVLLLDEPFEGIDPTSSHVIQGVLNEAAARGVTVLLTSHILPMLEVLASRIVVLREGELVWDSGGRIARGSLERTYFELVGEPETERLTWLGS